MCIHMYMFITKYEKKERKRKKYELFIMAHKHFR